MNFCITSIGKRYVVIQVGLTPTFFFIFARIMLLYLTVIECLILPVSSFRNGTYTL